MMTVTAPILTLFLLVALPAILFASMAAFALHCARFGRPRTSYVETHQGPELWKWWMEWWIWLWGPIEHSCVSLGITPNMITAASAALCGLAGVLLALGELSLGGWCYLFAASLDLVDGRVARSQNLATKAGAFFDSLLDRAAELFVFAGLMVHFRASPILYAVIAALGASYLVSYARARGESLGARDEAKVGGMQRAERVVLTGVPCALAPLSAFVAGPSAPDWIVGGAITLLAMASISTTIRRAQSIWRSLLPRVPEPERGTVSTPVQPPIGNLR